MRVQAKTSAGSEIEVGQLMVIGFEGTAMTSHLASLLSRIQPAGIILFARNLAGAEQTHQLLRDCQAWVDTPLLLGVDMEGGTVDRLKDVLAPAPSAAEVFATGDRKLFRLHGRMIGENCRALGFNTNFAPVLDLAFPGARKVMAGRVVSDQLRQVVTYAREFLLGLSEAGILGCGKHFPGLGAASRDTHYELPAVQKPFKKLWEQDLYPYRTLRRELPMVMVSHAAYPEVTRNNGPASLSRKWITGVLREKIGYRGVVVSDDLEMKGVLKAGPVEQAAVGHIRAGGNLCLICHDEDSIVRAHQALLAETQRDRKFARQADESIQRVLRLKERSPGLRRMVPRPSPAKIEKLSRRLWEFSERLRLETLARMEPS